MRLPWYERWWVLMACGLACTLGSVFVFWDLAEWETHPGGSRSLPWLAAGIYWVGGKWLLSAVVLAVGVCLTVTGARRRRAQAQQQPPAAEPGAAADARRQDGVGE